MTKEKWIEIYRESSNICSEEIIEKFNAQVKGPDDWVDFKEVHDRHRKRVDEATEVYNMENKNVQK